MRTTHMTKKKIITLGVLLAVVYAILLSPAIYASQGGGGTTGQCGSSYVRGGKLYQLTSTCEHAGAGWAYFVYDNGYTGSIDFGPAADGTGGVKTISNKCVGIGGFYHFGYIDKKSGSGWYGNTKASLNGIGSIGNPGRWAALTRVQGAYPNGTNWLAYNASYNPVPAYYEDYNIPSSGLSHSFYNGSGTKIAHLSKFVRTPTVWEHYKKWLDASGSSNIWNKKGNGGISYFCYGAGIEYTEFTSSTTANVDDTHIDNGGSREIYGNTANVRFLHTLTRNNKGLDKPYSTKWHVDGSNWTHAETSTAFNKNQSQVVWMTGNERVDIAPGQTRNFNQTFYYNSKASETSSTNPTNNANYSFSLHRPISDTIIGRTTGRVNGTDVSNGQVVEITSGNSFSVSFQHQIKRGDDNANGTVNVPYKTNIGGHDSRGQSNFNYGTVHQDTYNGLGENSDWTTVVSYGAETINGTLLPDETKTFCQSMDYAHILNYDSGNTVWTTDEYCVSVHRPKSTCAGKELGVLDGRNYGHIQARKTSTNGSPDWRDTGLSDNGDSSISIWAKPGNKVHFKEEMCEAAELPNQYFDLGKSISYGIDATSATYMENLNPSSWNNSSINGHAYEGTDIFGGNTYTKTTDSPASSVQGSKYNITDSHLGTSFYQRLTWTDLWTQGGRVVSSHNGTKNATATANVYIPYNYRTKPETTSNNNPYIMPGTETFAVTPTITIENRKNTPVNGNDQYSTKSKETKYQVISYRIPRTAASSNVYVRNDGYYKAGGTTDLASICTQFLNGGATNCRLEGNGTNTYDPGTTTLNPINIKTDEVIPIGTKICTVIAVWPSDSHNLTGDITNEDQEWNGITATENQSQRMWRISQPTCATVAKKPNFQSYNSGVYAEDEINTAVSNRTHRTSAGSELKRSYGSWSEFEVVSAAKPTLGLSSGARLWGGIPTQNDSSRYCYVSGLTFTNDKCNGSGDTRHVGQLGVNKLLASDPENIYNQIITRYTKSDSEDSGIGAVGSTYNLTLEGACDYDERNGRYVPRATNGNTPSFSCLSNGAYYTKVKGNAATENGERTVCNGWSCTTYISQMWTSTDGEHSSNTYVTHVKGTLYINQNFHYGNINDLENTRYTNISEIPQTIFIAKDIKIAPNVDHIDAWLIAENSIDTCYPTDGKPVSVDNCNSQLTITGPVITKKIYLNRTYGGGSTSMISNSNFNNWITEDSQGAELFKTNPFTYLWSYSQSQRYSQAITTYQKEMPTRY